MSATLSTNEQSWSGLNTTGILLFKEASLSEEVRGKFEEASDASKIAKEPSINGDPNFSNSTEPDQSSEVLGTWEQAGGFNGYLHIPDAPFIFPPQPFTVSSKGTKVIIESQPTGSWPHILIVLSRSVYARPTVEKFLLRPSNHTVEAELLYTRALYTLSETGACLLASEVSSNNQIVGIPFSFQAFTDEEINGILYRAKFARKLRFIETLFKVRFTVPENITPAQMRRIEMLFRGITEGEFASRGKDISVPVRAADSNLSEPPFSGVGPYKHYLGAEEAVLDHPRLLNVGPVYFMLKKAVAANHLALAPLREGRDTFVRFEVLDNQIIYRFETYADREGHKRAQRRLNQFYSQLEQEEPTELARTLLEPLMSDVLPDESAQIAVGWLEYHDFPDRFSPQEPTLDEERGCWRVPIYIVYASGKGAHVGDLLIDLKTGSIIEEPSAEVMYQEGLSLAEKILRVG